MNNSRKLKNTNGKAFRQRINHPSNGQVYHSTSPSNHHQLSSPRSDSNMDRSTDWKVDILIMGLALLIIPFLPACNLFFYVGFVVAERILYIPSLGFCLLITAAILLTYQKLQYYNLHQWINVAIIILVLLYTARTISRNDDWLDEENLYE